MTDPMTSAENDNQPSAFLPMPSTEAIDSPSGISKVVTVHYSESECQPESETEQPVILELGSTNNSHVNNNLNSSAMSDALFDTEYAIDMHMNNIESYMNTNPSNTYAMVPDNGMESTTATGFYNNPYTPHVLPTATTLSSINSALPTDPMLAVGGYPPPSQIPQTVNAWPNPGMESVAVIGEGKPLPEVVPPAMYLSYMGSGVREHLIAKESNPSWKEKALQIEKDYKKTACDRERTRMRDMNKAFDLLRSKLPISKPNGKKYSKIESLRIAINYINHLNQILREDDARIAMSQHDPTNSAISNNNYNNNSLDNHHNHSHNHNQTVNQEGNSSEFVIQLSPRHLRGHSFHHDNRK